LASQEGPGPWHSYWVDLPIPVFKRYSRIPHTYAAAPLEKVVGLPQSAASMEIAGASISKPRVYTLHFGRYFQS
jgi:hypothetical protein